MSYGVEGRRKIRPAIDYENHPVFQKRPLWRRELHRIIFGHLTPGGKRFDILLIATILASVVIVMLESVEQIRLRSGTALRGAEWVFTILFTIEYGVRLIAAERARTYARTFFGVVDLLSIVPTYLSVIVPGGQALTVIRILRVLRVFRVLKLAQFIGGEQLLVRSIRASAYKIAVFLVAVFTVVVVLGSVMYFIEGAESGFTSIPRGVYWAIVTLTTVGFGDITPQTALGQGLAALLMILGYGMIAVPTGIVTAEMSARTTRAGAEAGTAAPSQPPLRVDATTAETAAAPLPPGGPRTCLKCGSAGHDPDARNCKYCGMELPG